MERGLSLLGLLTFMLLAWALSSRKGRMNFRLILTGVGLQLLLGVLILWTTPGQMVFEAARVFITRLISFSDSGAEMVFGEDFEDHFFAFSVLSTIIFVSSVMAVLFYLGIIQRVVSFMGWLMVKIMDVSGAESLAASANVFIGQTEAPLVIKPYISSMTRSEIMALMTGGMATVAGGVMAAYASFGADPGHLLAASLMSAPASLVIAKIMIPETENSYTKGVVKVDIPVNDQNIFDAACRGASEGLKLALNVAAMLIAFISIAALLNYFLSLFPEVAGAELSVERILSWLFLPFAFLLGVGFEDLYSVSMLLGKKIFLNEFVAYMELVEIKEDLSERSFTLATYALCGFANFGSIAIQIGGLGALVPERRADLAKLGFLAMIGGTLAALMTASVAGILI